MEVELRQDYISCWDNSYRTTLNQEETTEMIVPDACPDILQILDGEGKLFLQRKDAMDGKAEFSGCIKVTVLYQPEGEGNLCSMDAVLPFSTTIENEAITRRSKLMVTPRLQKVDVHLLSPRKMLIKVNFAMELTVCTPQTLTICPGVDQGEDYGIRQKLGDYQSYVTTAALEKTFNYSDVLSLPAGRPDMRELLRTRASCTCNEAKVIGSKVVLKGEAKLDTLYRGEDEGIHTATFSLPFSQIMESGEAEDDPVPQVTLISTDV